jgi:hypothetical protein
MCPREDLMNPTTHFGLAFAACLAVSASAHAQSAVTPAKPDPLNPSAAVPAAAHATSLARYRPAGDVKVGSWREANDTVARIGGWRVYAREAAKPEPSAQVPSAPGSAPAPAPAASRPMSGQGRQ